MSDISNLYDEKKFINKVLVLSSVIILLAAVEAFMMAKDIDIYAVFKKLNPASDQSQYINFVLLRFISIIIHPVLVSLFVYFTKDRYINEKMFKMFFIAMTLIQLVNLIFQFNLNSIFYYLIIIAHIYLLVLIIKKK